MLHIISYSDIHHLRFLFVFGVTAIGDVGLGVEDKYNGVR